MTKVRLSLTVSDSHMRHLDKIAEAARKVGMVVEKQLESIGVLTGTIESGKIGLLHQIAGVSGVEKEREVQLPPPDSPIQ